MDYSIPFRGLKEGTHRFEFTADDAFFAAYPETEVIRGNVHAVVDVLKRSNGLETVFTLRGSVFVECDRCLEECEQTVDFSGKLYFEFGHETMEVSDELIMLDENENTIDAGQYIGEYISLSLPMQKIHGTDKNGKSLCNAEMVETLKKYKINNDDIADPRWDKLKDLMN